jgi:hypothetical protein
VENESEIPEYVMQEGLVMFPIKLGLQFACTYLNIVNFFFFEVAGEGPTK